uniref:Uncharacterized protein n=1 Tax=Arundo donax TaxID=35708 RepID=A0A0A9AF58_ARUDO
MSRVDPCTSLRLLAITMCPSLSTITPRLETRYMM